MKTNNNILVGVFLVVLGILFLLRNFDLFYFNFGDVFRLWPIALIYIGVGMLPIDQKTKTYLETGVIVLFFSILIVLPYLSNKTRHNDRFEYRYDDEETGSIQLDETKLLDNFRV